MAQRVLSKEVFRRTVIAIEEAADASRRRWKTTSAFWLQRSQFTWLPLNYGLRPHQYDTQDEWDTVLRGRWQLQVLTPDFSIGSAERFYALASIEPFTDFGNPTAGRFAERIRTNIGLGKRVTPALRIDLNYLFHRVQVNDDIQDFDLDDHVLRLRFFYTFN